MKREVTVKRFIAAPREQLFDAFTQHEAYKKLPLVLSSELLEPGQGNPSNGEGAVRKIRTPGITLVERVVACERPDYWDYLFLEWPLPIPHAGGRMSFKEVAGGTEVTWMTSYEVPSGILGKLATGGLALGNLAVLKLLIYWVGNEAKKQITAV